MGTERLRRVRAGRYTTRDGRFTITSSGYQRSGTTWTVEDTSGRSPFRRTTSSGEVRRMARKIVDTLEAARQMIEDLRERETAEEETSQ